MPITRQWNLPANASASVNAQTVTLTPSGVNGFNLGADSVQATSFLTAPPGSSTAASITFGTPIQNTLGFDAQLLTSITIMNLSVGTVGTCIAATSAAASIGGGGTGALTNFLNNYTPAAGSAYFFTSYVPSGYWFNLVATQANNLSPLASVTSQWQPI